MEYVEGRSLSEIIRTEGPLHPRRAAEITADVAAALGFAHRNGVVHRDVKPGNIIIAPTGQVKVADFGIAQAITGSGQTAEPHPGRRGDGHRHLLLARAGPGQAGRSPQRPLLARLRALRDAHQPAAVHRRHAGGHRLQARAGGRSAAEPRRASTCPPRSRPSTCSCWPRTRASATPRPRTSAPICAATSRASRSRRCARPPPWRPASPPAPRVGAATQAVPTVAPAPVVARDPAPVAVATPAPAGGDQPANRSTAVPLGAAGLLLVLAVGLFVVGHPAQASANAQVQVTNGHRPARRTQASPVARASGFKVNDGQEANADGPGGHRVRPGPEGPGERRQGLDRRRSA